MAKFTEEQKKDKQAKWEALTPEDRVKIVKEVGVELAADQLDQITGGSYPFACDKCAAIGAAGFKGEICHERVKSPIVDCTYYRMIIIGTI